MITWNTDRNKFPLRLHKWETFVLSFHNNYFSYSGRCDCCHADFNGKKMPYELLSGSVAEHVTKTEVAGKKYEKMQHIFQPYLRAK